VLFDISSVLQVTIGNAVLVAAVARLAQQGDQLQQLLQQQAKLLEASLAGHRALEPTAAGGPGNTGPNTETQPAPDAAAVTSSIASPIRYQNVDAAVQHAPSIDEMVQNSWLLQSPAAECRNGPAMGNELKGSKRPGERHPPSHRSTAKASAQNLRKVRYTFKV
jgi:hypothetical protein